MSKWPQPSPPPAPPTLDQLAGTVEELRTRLANVEKVTRENTERLTEMSVKVARIPELAQDVQALMTGRTRRRGAKEGRPSTTSDAPSMPRSVP